MKCALVTETDRADWEQFVHRFPQAHHAFQWQWRRVLAEVFGHKSMHACVRDESGALRGILPLVIFESFLFGRALISLPYLNGGGILADSRESFEALAEFAGTLATTEHVKYVELRQRDEQTWYPTSTPLRTHKVAMKLALIEDPEKMFAAFPGKLRSQIRRPSKSGIVARVTERGQHDVQALDAFYQVFSKNMRDLGTPVYPKKLFHRALEAFLPTALSGRHRGKMHAESVGRPSGEHTHARLFHAQRRRCRERVVDVAAQRSRG